MLVEEVLQLLYFSDMILFMHWHPLFLINFSEFRPDDGLKKKIEKNRGGLKKERVSNLVFLVKKKKSQRMTV